MAEETPLDSEHRLRDRLDARARINEHFWNCLVTKGDKFPDASSDHSNKYIRIGDVEKIWSGEGTIERALYPNILPPQDVALIQENHLLFLSVLVSLEAHTHLDRFTSYAYREDGSLLYANQQMPLQRQEIPDLGDRAFRKKFEHAQYKFSPVVIYESSEPTIIDENRPLPFQAYTTTSEGAFGRVTKVTISPKYFVTEAGVKASEDTVVAVKRFHARIHTSVVDSRQEINNLSVLKESITSHRYIRTHLAALFHKGEHIILLPWADKYDLHHFLLEGHDQWGNQVYSFETVFDCHSQHFVRDTYKQIANIAAALKWLHVDVRPFDKRIYFAHMDLKPDNILIDNDSAQYPSSVGKWVLTDFGISAFKETDEKLGKNYVTVRDYVEQKQNLTLNTHARREAGAYQPPEMERLTQAADESSNIPVQRVVGRRSDIWSFGCIFAEVVAFSSGGRAAVSDFRDARRGTHNDDYFYTYRRSFRPNLSPGISGLTPELRPEMVAWLMNMTENLATLTMAHGVLKCSVAKVLDILKIDQRPGAEEVQEAMEHLTSHFKHPFCPDPDCAIQGLPPPIQSAPARPLHTQTAPAQPSPTKDPTAIVQVPPQIIVQAHTADAEAVTHTGRTEVEDKLPHDPSLESEEGDLSLNEDPEFAPLRPVDSDELYADPDLQNTKTGIGRDNTIRLSQPQDQRERPVLPPRPSTTDSGYRSVLHTPGPVKATYGVQTPDTKILRIALCSSGRFVATITKPSKISLKSTRYTIGCHEVSPTDLVLVPYFSEPLPKANSWDNISLHSDLIAAWGDNTRGVKQVLLFRARSGPSKVWAGSQYSWLSTLRSVIVARQDRILFVCNRDIFYVDLKSQDLSPQVLPGTMAGHAFKHAAVDNDIGILYAWSCGKKVEELSVWRLSNAHGDSIVAFEGRQRYYTRTHGDFNATVLPFNGRKGCAIRLDGDDYLFTPAETSSSIFSLTTYGVGQRSKVHVYDGTSIFLTETSILGTSVRERCITGAGSSIERTMRTFRAQISIAMDEITDMRMVSMPPRDGLVLIVVAKNGRITFVPVTT